MLIYGLFCGLKAASDLIKANVEPILEQYRPVILASLTFSKFTLGTVAPQFTGLIMDCFFLILTSSDFVPFSFYFLCMCTYFAHIW